MRVLVSGFTTFSTHTENSSEIIANELRSVQIPGIELHTTILPVAFSQSWEHLKGQIESFKPDVVICMGLAGNRSKIELEKVAINLIHCEIPDNEGVLIQDKLIIDGGAEAYFSTLPLKAMREVQTPYPVAMSFSAGAYVCNYLFYRLMEYTKGSGVRAGFVHLPPLGSSKSEILESILMLLKLC